MDDEGARTCDENSFNRSLASLAVHIAALGAPRAACKPYSPTRFEDQVRVLLDAKVPVIQLHFGIPPREILEECRMKGIIRRPASTPSSLPVLKPEGVDGSFLRSAEHSLMGTLSLVPQVVDVVDVPAIAAGGIGDA